MDLHSKLTAIAQQSKQQPSTTPLTQQIKGRDGRLGVGTHHCRVEGVNTEFLVTRGFIDLTYGDRQGAVHRDRIWVLTKTKDKLSWRLRRWLQGVLGDAEYGSWMSLLSRSPTDAFQSFRGLDLQVTLAYGQGYIISSTTDGWAAVNPHTNEILTTAPSIAIIKKHCAAQGIPQVWLNVEEVVSARPADNCQAIDYALEGLHAAPPSETAADANLRRFGADQ